MQRQLSTHTGACAARRGAAHALLVPLGSSMVSRKFLDDDAAMRSFTKTMVSAFLLALQRGCSVCSTVSPGLPW